MNRTAIFAFYDAQGVVDEYVLVLLRALRPFCGRIVCVVNGELTDVSASALSSVCDVTLRRPNEGLDITAYRQGLRYVLEHPAGEDELLFFNATVFGPVYPFRELFGTMDAQVELDFWGMTRYTGHDEDLWGMTGLGYIPPHIQSYFWAVRKSLFDTADFKSYWENLPEIHSYKEAVSLHEMLFTKRFEELGYRWDTYIPESAYNRYYSYLLAADPVYLLKEHRCPVVKRKSFISDRTEQSMPVSGDSGRALYAFLRDETDYDISLIAKSITRTENNFDYTLAVAEVLIADEEKKAAGTKPETPTCKEAGIGTEIKEDSAAETAEAPEGSAASTDTERAKPTSIGRPTGKEDKRTEAMQASAEEASCGIPAETAQIVWITDPNCLEALRGAGFDRRALYIYHTSDVDGGAVRSLFPDAAAIRSTGADVRAALKQARADIGESAEYVAWLCAVPEVLDYNPGNPPKAERDFTSFTHALRFCALTGRCAAHMRMDSAVGAVVPFPLTHRRHISPEPRWESKLAALEAAGGEYDLPPLKKEPLCAGWNAFVADRECFARLVAMAGKLSGDSLELTDFGYLVPLAAQSLGRLVCFAGDEQIAKSQLLTAYTQLRKVTGNVVTPDLQREDQLLVVQRRAIPFFHDFFNPASLKDRLYFALMALLPRKWFVRLLGRGRAEEQLMYPYDVVRQERG